MVLLQLIIIIPGKYQVLEMMCRNQNTPTLLVGVKNCSATVENTSAVPQKSKCRIALGPFISVLDIFPKKLKTSTQTNT